MTPSSRVLQLNAIGGDLVAGTRAMPTPGPNDVVITVRAAGICHSDEHYRAGRSTHIKPPHVLGHEVAGDIVAVGSAVDAKRIGERVCVHYVISCGTCPACTAGREQFCESYAMVGMHRDGGYAEHIVVPSVNAIPLPTGVGYGVGAILMCAGGTALHALRRGRFVAGESVCVVGAGGIGMLAVRIARALGATTVLAIDADPAKLLAAHHAGAVAVDAADPELVAKVRAATGGAGADVALDCVGIPPTTQTALRTLGVHGRAVVVGLAGEPVSIHTYRDLLALETELMGSNDHLRGELVELVALAERGALGLSENDLRSVPLDPLAVNAVLAELRAYRSPVRSVIVP